MRDENEIVDEIQREAGANEIIDWANQFLGRDYDFSEKSSFQERLSKAKRLFKQLDSEQSKFEALQNSNLIADTSCVDMIESDELRSKIINTLIDERSRSMDLPELVKTLDSNIAYAIAGLKDDNLREEFLKSVTVRNGGKKNIALVIASFRSEDKRREFMQKFDLDDLDIQLAERSFKDSMDRDIRSDRGQKTDIIVDGIEQNSSEVFDVKTTNDTPEEPITENNDSVITNDSMKSEGDSRDEEDLLDLSKMSLEELEQIESDEDKKIADLEKKISTQKEEMRRLEEQKRQESINRIKKKMEERKRKEKILEDLQRGNREENDDINR